MAWRLAVENRAGVVQVSDLPFQSINVNWVLNSPGAIEVTVNMRDTEITEANLDVYKRQLALFRDGTRVWGGYLWAHRVEMNQDGDHALTMYGEGYYSALRHRVVTSDLIYNATNAQTIMWNLISHTQGKADGDLGITQGAHTGGNTPIAREYCALEYPIVAAAIDEITQLDDGCDWAMGPNISYANDKQFRTYSPRRGTDLSGSVTLDQLTMSNLSYEIDASTLANYIYNVGLDDCNPPVEIVTNSTSLNQYGLMESVQDIEASYKRDLLAHGREYLRNYKQPTWRATAKYWDGNGPAWGSFDVGDIISLSSNVGFGTFTKDMRVTAIDISLAPPNVDFWSVTLDSVVA